MNDTYGRQYRCEQLEDSSTSDLDDKTPGYLKEFDRMTGRKPHTPWSTSNAEYGKHIEAVKLSSPANYKFVSPAEADTETLGINPSVVTEVKDKDENQIATPKSAGSNENVPGGTVRKHPPKIRQIIPGETTKK